MIELILDSNEANGTWCMARINRIDNTSSQIEISYIGWTTTQLIDTISQSDIIAPLHTHTSPCIFNNPVPPRYTPIVTHQSKYQNDLLLISMHSNQYELQILEYNTKINEYDQKQITMQTFGIVYNLPRKKHKHNLFILVSHAWNGIIHFLHLDMNENKFEIIKQQSFSEEYMLGCLGFYFMYTNVFI